MTAKLPFLQRINGKKRFCLITFILLLLLICATVRFNIKGHFEGLFLLKANKGSLLELKDDLYLNDAHSLIWGIDFDDPVYRLHYFFNRNQHKVPYLTYEWFAKDGVGYVRNHLPGGRQLVTNFSRFTFEENDGLELHGLFVGGGMPADVRDGKVFKENKSGMAYFDGKRWFHIWCNANEAMSSPQTLNPIFPNQWKFIESKVMNASEKELTIRSRHIITVDNATLQMDRIAYFTAGDPYFILSMEITNIGKVFAHYVYTYGDEPWLGNYGTSGGNIGWVKDRLIQKVGPVDSKKYSYAGFFDYGNDSIGEGHNFTKMANFLQWKSDEEPILYFTNGPLEKYNPLNHEPLESNARYLGIQFNVTNLIPGESVYYDLAIGMAGLDPKTGLPVKPATLLDP
jgi:hypothetical protein